MRNTSTTTISIIIALDWGFVALFTGVPGSFVDNSHPDLPSAPKNTIITNAHNPNHNGH